VPDSGLKTLDLEAGISEWLIIIEKGQKVI
jgi:hypothetical protein